jgi:hypothetical protein
VTKTRQNKKWLAFGIKIGTLSVLAFAYGVSGLYANQTEITEIIART